MVSVFPTGTTAYQPEDCWNGYTLVGGANLIDMNGLLLHRWDQIRLHAKLIPGGQVLGPTSDEHRLVQVDWNI